MALVGDIGLGELSLGKATFNCSTDKKDWTGIELHGIELDWIRVKPSEIEGLDAIETSWIKLRLIWVHLTRLKLGQIELDLL